MLGEVVSLFKLLLFALLALLRPLLYLVVNALAALICDHNGRGQGTEDWPLPPSSSPLGEFTSAAVAADNGLCSAVGRDVMLLARGNAVDAAVATLLCLGVMNPQSSGLGGGHLMTIYNATTRHCVVIDARERAPLAATPDMFVKAGTDASLVGWLAIGVPGELHGAYTAHSRFGSGRVPWARLFQPSIELQEAGPPTTTYLARSLNKKRDVVFSGDPTMRAAFINPATGDLYKRGERITTRQALALLATYRKLAASSDPINEFYGSGQLAKRMLAEFKSNGAIITVDDFVQYASVVRDGEEGGVIYANLSNARHQVCSPPPPSTSALLIAIVKTMEEALNGESGDDTFEQRVDRFHKFIEASKLAYAARGYLGDSAHVKEAIPLARRIVNDEWAKRMSAKIGSTSSANISYYFDSVAEVLGLVDKLPHRPMGPPDGQSTTNVAVVDPWGNAVSVTSTINFRLGAQVMSSATGILWNSNMGDFAVDMRPEEAANFIAPGKRPRSSMSPLVVFTSQGDSDAELLTFGAAGGLSITTGVAFALTHMLLFNYTVKEAIDMPHLHNHLDLFNPTPARRRYLSSSPLIDDSTSSQSSQTQYEPRWPQRYIDALSAKGHDFVAETDTATTVITGIKRSNGVIYANSDFRKGLESRADGFL